MKPMKLARTFQALWQSLVTGTLLALPGCLSLPSADSYKPAATDDTVMKKELDRILRETSQPAMAAALIRGDSIIAKASTGILVFGQPDEVSLTHRFHIGSTTKAFTSLLVALLVRDGILRYDLTLAEALPDLPIREEYRKMTLRDLMLSRAGILAFQRPEFEDARAIEMLQKTIPGQTGSGQEQRRLITAYALAHEPINKPGSRMVYSNVSWAIVGHIAERIARRPFEQLLQERIFTPLKMSGARIGGWPASGQDPKQPRGHYMQKDGPRPQPLDDSYVLPEWMNPAGGIHCTIYDYALFAREVLAGLQGRGQLLSREDYLTIHSVQGKERMDLMYYGAHSSEVGTYGYGWGVFKIDGQSISAGDGSAGTFYARIIIIPYLNAAFVGFTNAGDGQKALSLASQRLAGLPF